MIPGDEILQAAGHRLGDLLTAAGLVAVTAESCTGGWVAKVLTDRPGSSAYVAGGLVTYSNGLKQQLLGVPAGLLNRHGAVSGPVVEQMVLGAITATGADTAVAISGVAGPGGGSEDKPTGTVWFAWGASGKPVETRLCRFDGDREAVRRQSVQVALEGLEGYLKRLFPAGPAG